MGDIIRKVLSVGVLHENQEPAFIYTLKLQGELFVDEVVIDVVEEYGVGLVGEEIDPIENGIDGFDTGQSVSFL